MKPFIITIAAHSTQVIKLSEYSLNAQNIELIVGSCAQVTCIDDREFKQELLEFSLSCTVKKNARIVYCDQRRFTLQAEVSSTIIFRAQRDSIVHFEQLQQGGKKVKTIVDAQLIGECSEIILRFGAHLAADQKQEITTVQSHQASFTKSNCVMKVIVSDSARSLYNGMIQIENAAEKSEAFQTHKAMLMSDSAYAYARPSLQVLTNDVQCGHGSAIGQLDVEQLVYLQARGMSFDRARKVLLQAFMDELYSSEYMKENCNVSMKSNE